MEKYPGRRILVFDSLNASLGEGVSVFRAVQLKKEGKTLDELDAVLREERECINVILLWMIFIICKEGAEYLKRRQL